MQIYVADRTPDIFKAKKKLKGFCKVYLEAGEEKEVTVELNQRAFAHYGVDTGKWEVLTGRYLILAETSGENIRLSWEITINIVFNTPLIRLVQQSGGTTPLGLMQAAVACANGDMSAAEQLAAMMGNV